MSESTRGELMPGKGYRGRLGYKRGVTKLKHDGGEGGICSLECPACEREREEIARLGEPAPAQSIPKDSRELELPSADRRGHR